MATKNQLIGISMVIIIMMITRDTYADCRLEKLKHFAMKSCETLAKELHDYHRRSSINHPQFKREIRNNNNNGTRAESDEYVITKRHFRPTYLRINKKYFPSDGYLVFDHIYAKILKTNDPKYQIIKKPSKQNLRHHRNAKNNIESTENNETIRRKRNDVNDGRIAVSYCCSNVNRCNAEDFCIL